MRNFDNWIRYQDNDRNPLHGCIQFNVKDGNTVAPIYDSDGTALANPQVTDTYGRTKHQVFIDTDVVAYFYKYVGEGVWSNEHDIDTSDVSKWVLQYTTENMLDVLANITSDTAVSIGTMDELRAVDVDGIPLIDGKKTITLLGYFTSGDKEPINYIWNPESTEQDNGGSVIASDNHITGRWIMVKPTEHVDSRHFGAFPSNSMNMQDQTYEIDSLFTYCSVNSLRPFFNGSTDYRWFKYTNLNVIADAIDVSEGTRFMDLGNNTINGDWNGDPFFNLSNTNVVAKNVKTSWCARQFISPEHVIIDNDNNLLQTTYSDCTVGVNINTGKTFSFTNCTVNINKSLTGICSFSNCIINSKNMITSGSYFTNCKLTEEMFYGSPYIHVDINCIADFNDFEHKQLMWLRIKEQQNQINYDWEGVLTSQNPWEGVVDSDRWLINYKTTNPNAVLKESTNAHTYFIENCTGSLTLECKANNNYVIKDSEISLKLVDGVSGITISVQNSTLSFTQDIEIAALSMRNSVLLSDNNIICDNFTSYGGIVSAPIMARNSVVKDSQVNKTFTLIAHSGAERTVTYLGGLGGNTQVTATVSHYITGFLDNNIFNAQLVIDGQYGLMGSGTGHSVIPITIEQCLVDSFVFTNNISNYNGDAWYIWANMGAWRDDSLHHYIWKNNTGKFECKTTITATLRNNEQDTSTPGIFNTTSGSNAWGKWCSSELITDPVVGLNEHYIDLGHRYFCTMDLFSIGTLNVHFDLEFWLEGEVSNEESMGVNSFINGNPAGIAHLNDKCICGPFEYIVKGDWEGARTNPFKVADVRNVNCIATTEFAPILTPSTDFAWSKTFQIRNFAVGSTINFANGTTFTMHIRQL